MRNLVLSILFLSVTTFSVAQELNCQIKIDAQQVNQTNQQIFKTLERSLNDFVNKTQWTNKKYAPQERINCSMVINVSEYSSDQFIATIQVQSSRPIYSSSFESPVFNFNDKQFRFIYQEFQPIVYNPNAFTTNLVAVVAYYVHVILGIDADTFSLRGGSDYYAQAQQIVNLAQSSGFLGWQEADGNRTRWKLLDNMLNNTYKEYRTVMYNYHRVGMDMMADDPSAAKQSISGVMEIFKALSNRRPNSFLMQTFFDAKAEEMQSIFSGGPKVNVTQLVETLNSIAPFHASKWEKIKF
ncbi:hypothetical protein IMCC3317_01310 [Kordia antarctica]|uniref:DUF4835 domain-containing protein n=1 Tax=Kordia antarctica TaxID=1218801 RepID=A0A7L4ZDS0_9FLAO|nr:DUF4835 family protein [Kordia antarctica]QHI34787.1 hypothetical protein IMCC3317_01310 [Kordia antarctica]